MEKETLEQAAERLASTTDEFNMFIAGAKWQAERMYSKEAVEEMFATLKRNSVDNIAIIHNIDLFIESWTREFKKQ
jgi:hypothetical protein